MNGSFLLDTSIVLHYTRRSPVYEHVEAQFHLTTSRFQPLVSVITLGEIYAIAYRLNWGPERRDALAQLLSRLVPIDIHDSRIIDAYARISAHATAHGWALHSQKNDLWIAATAHVTGATLLTTDQDFKEAHGIFIECAIFDNRTGQAIR